MKKKIVAAAALCVLSVSLVPASFGQQADPKSPPPAADPKAAAPATEDIVYMRDGRVLHGQILAETSKLLTIEYRDLKLNIKTKVNLHTEEIAAIERDQPMAAPATDVKPDNDADPAPMTLKPAAGAKKLDYKPSYGASMFKTDDPAVPSLYIVPMGGQFGTDVRSDVYKPVLDDIRKYKPSVVVIALDSADSLPPGMLDPYGYDAPKTDPALERSLLEFEDYRELVHMFRDELTASVPDTKQVLWIKDSDGISATIAMAWDQMYMSPKARFGGMITVLDQSGADKWPDKDVRAKMMAAWLGIAKSFLEKGGYSLALADAMLQPDKTLSGSWKGREVEWQLDKKGEYLVDDSDKRTVNFVAKTAEDLCITKGTAEDLDDLALMLGYREYRIIDGKQDDLTLGYVKEWREVYASCRENLKNYEKYLSEGNLGKGKACLEKVLAALNNYKAIELRLGTDYGLDKVTLMTYIDQLKEQLKMLAQQKKAGGSGAGGRAGGGGRAGQGGGSGTGTENPG